MPLNLEPVQSRSGATTSYEDAFADELEGIYGRGIHDLAGVVSALNETGVRPPDGADWSEEAFTREIARLGAKEANR